MASCDAKLYPVQKYNCIPFVRDYRWGWGGGGGGNGGGGEESVWGVFPTVDIYFQNTRLTSQS